MTALLAELIESSDLDGAVVARESDSDPLRGEPFLATSREDLLEAGGSIYNQTMELGRIDDLLAEEGLDPAETDLALVGTPCVIQGATALDRYDHEPADPIALMCTRSFEYGRLVSRLERFDVDPERVAKLDITAGVLYALDESGNVLLEADVDEFDAAGLRGCGSVRTSSAPGPTSVPETSARRRAKRRSSSAPRPAETHGRAPPTASRRRRSIARTHSSDSPTGIGAAPSRSSRGRTIPRARSASPTRRTARPTTAPIGNRSR